MTNENRTAAGVYDAEESSGNVQPWCPCGWAGDVQHNVVIAAAELQTHRNEHTAQSEEY